MPPEAAGDMGERRGRARHVHERRQIGARLDGHAHEGGLAQRTPQPVHQLAQPARVIRRGDHRASARPGPRGVAVGVGDAVAVLEVQGGVGFVERNHLRRGLQERVHPGGVEIVAEHPAQIGARRGGVLDDPGAGGERVERRPDPAAGPGGGATEHRLLLGDNHLQPVPGGSHRGRQPARPRADDQQVAIEPHWPPPLPRYGDIISSPLPAPAGTPPSGRLPAPAPRWRRTTAPPAPAAAPAARDGLPRRTGTAWR